MAIFNVVSDGTGMECANGISIIATRTLVRRRRWQHGLWNYQFELKQLCQHPSISHWDDVKSSKSTVFLLLLILLTRRLMSWRVKRSIIPLRSTSFVLRYNSRHNGHISHWSKIGLHAQPCVSKPDNTFVKEILNLLFQGHTVLCIMTGRPIMEITPSHHIVLE